MDKIYMVVNYDYDNVRDFEDDWDLCEYDSLGGIYGVFSNPEAAMNRALDIAKEEADVLGRPYRIIARSKSRYPEPIFDAVILILTDDDSTSVYAVIEKEVRNEYTPHMEDDMPLEVEEV